MVFHGRGRLYLLVQLSRLRTKLPVRPSILVRSLWAARLGKKNGLNGGVPSVRLGSLWRYLVGSLVGDYQSG